jgi:uncharacterized membrane protein YkvA (DUF1232 family)
VWWHPIAIVAGSLVAAWLVAIAFLALARPDRDTIRQTMRLLPDSLRLLRRLASDRTIPLRTRVLVWILIGYLVSPIDVIPDFVPVVGYADDVIIASLVLRHLVRRAGPDKLRGHWPGSPEGLAQLLRLLRIDQIT